MQARLIGILGGTGFVGRHLAAALVEQGHSVRVISRDPQRHRELKVLPTVEMVAGDVHDAAVLRARLQGCDAVVNLVGILHESRRGGDFQKAHVELPRKVVDACRELRITRLLHMSALNADAARGPSHYLRSKGEGEDLAHLGAGQGLQVTSFRPSVIFGPEDSFLNRFASLLRLAPGVFPLACPNARFAPVYVGDVAAAFAGALDNRDTFGRRYELCGPHRYTLRQLVEFIAAAIGVRRWIIGLDDPLSRLQAHVLAHVPGKPMTYDNYLSLQVDSVCRDNGLAALGVAATSLEAAAPAYLGPRAARGRYDRFRGAGRSGA